MGLSNYQLVLLDNLIYLDTVVEFGNIKGQNTIEDVINALLYAEGNPANDAGTITTDWNNHYIPDDPEAKNCMMSKEEWIEVLKVANARFMDTIQYTGQVVYR